MITKFDSLFAGHVDMQDIGYAGTAVNDRRFSNEHLTTAFNKAEAIAQCMDRMGYDTFWLAEHHFQREGYECIPNIPLLIVHLAHLTQRIRLGCAFNVTPMWHPLRLAEDFATADILTGGRAVFGVARGYHTREVETFGAPLLDQESNRALFEEQVEIIFKAFNEESFSHHGKYYNIPADVPYRGYQMESITLVPRPLNRPVECWQPIQGGTARALDFMAKHGIKGTIGGGVAEGGAMDSVVLGYRDALARAGRETLPGSDLNIGFQFYIAGSEEEAMRDAAAFYEENTKIVGPLRLTRGLTEQQILDLSDPRRAPHADLPSIRKAAAAGSFLCGPPELVAEKLMSVAERYPGLERVTVSHPIGTPQRVITEQLEWFSRDVMPAFKGKVAEASPAT
ncbi:MAG TPA: LLM class flavin-dependent oxidoreductase [Dehalococcoidia bacterium]|nr:LLM class flavin-dependent oxidoreductase [Dehalococcoidia bacterium]